MAKPNYTVKSQPSKLTFFKNSSSKSDEDIERAFEEQQSRKLLSRIASDMTNYAIDLHISKYNNK